MWNYGYVKLSSFEKLVKLLLQFSWYFIRTTCSENISQTKFSNEFNEISLVLYELNENVLYWRYEKICYVYQIIK